MLIDLHAHLVAQDIRPARMRFNLWNRILQRLLGVSSASEFRTKIVSDFADSPVEKVVLCAIENSSLAAGNAEVKAFCQTHAGFLYGANLNPFSSTLEADVATAVRDGAVLVKLMPSFQRVDPADSRCDAYWQLMRAHQLPVLVHTGPEHTLAGGPARFNDPARLRRAAEMGVTLICAHCGCPMMLHERSGFAAWAELVRAFPNVYGDVSGFCGCVRHWWLRRILRNPQLAARLVFGTDFPSFPHVFRRNETNIFQAWLTFFRSAGCDTAFFTRGAELLKKEVL